MKPSEQYRHLQARKLFDQQVGPDASSHAFKLLVTRKLDPQSLEDQIARAMPRDWVVVKEAFRNEAAKFGLCNPSSMYFRFEPLMTSYRKFLMTHSIHSGGLSHELLDMPVYCGMWKAYIHGKGENDAWHRRCMQLEQSPMFRGSHTLGNNHRPAAGASVLQDGTASRLFYGGGGGEGGFEVFAASPTELVHKLNLFLSPEHQCHLPGKTSHLSVVRS